MILCCYGFSVAWYASLYAVHCSQKEIISRSDLHKNKLVELTFSKADFESNAQFTFDDDEDEFEYNKQMYDVVQKKIANDSVYVTCISDTEEENLRDFAMAHILSREDNAPGKELPIFKFRPDQYTNGFQTNFSCDVANQDRKRFIKYNTGKPDSPYIHVSSPPPWAAKA